MERLNLLIFLPIINIFSCGYTMETPRKHDLKLVTTSTQHLFTSKKKIVDFSREDANHVSYFSMYNAAAHLISSNPNNPTFIPGQQPEFKEQDILRLKELIHKPSLFNQERNKKYYEALSLAVKFKVPFLYANLLNAQLPPTVLALIIKNYLCLHDLPNAMREKLCNNEITCLYNDYKNTLSNDSLKEEIRNNYTDWLTAINDDFDNIFTTITLPQALFLSLLCNQQKNSSITITLRPSTLGFKECASLLKDNETFMDTIYEHKLITLKYELSQQNNDRLVALHFKV